MDKKKLTSLIIIAVLVITACIGGVFAYMFRDTGNKDYDFHKATVQCELKETTDNPLTQKKSITVESLSNVDTYVRVRLVTYWVQYDGEGNAQVVGRPSGAIEFTYDSENWLKGENNTYYYKKPLAPNETTADLIANGNVITLAIEDEIYYQVIDVFAEAIQAEPASAANEAWGVTIDSDGNISAAN